MLRLVTGDSFQNGGITMEIEAMDCQRLPLKKRTSGLGTLVDSMAWLDPDCRGVLGILLVCFLAWRIQAAKTARTGLLAPG